jgi:hypothetical protein
MNYSNWKRDERSPASLFLDSSNPRIPPSPQPLTEAQLIEELILHDKDFELAKNIAANGFFPNEAVIAVKEHGKTIVVEGNRRLAACKLLISPEAAPVSYQAKFTALSSKFDQTLLTTIPVLVAPSREAVMPLLIARHTASQIEGWEPFMKARFYYNLVESGASVEDVANKFGLKPSEVKNSMRTYNLYQMACRLDLPPETAAIVRNPRKFNLSNLDRVFESPKARQFFGVQFTEDGSLRGKIDPDEFKKGFTRVVKDIADGVVESRKLNTAADIATYLDSFPAAAKPDVSKKGSFDAASFLSGGPSGPLPPLPKPAKNPKKGTVPVGLIPRSFPCNSSNSKVQKLCDELKRLSPQKFPNACAFTFRSFLEHSVFCFLYSRGEIAKITSETRAEIAKKNAKKPQEKWHKLEPHWTPSLHTMMKRMADSNSSIIPQGHVTKALNKVIKDEEELFALNLFVHNTTYHPSEPRLRAIWANLEEFLKIVVS